MASRSRLRQLVLSIGVSAVLASASLASRASATPSAACVGDCDQDGFVTVDELVRGVNIALGALTVDNCPQFDRDGSNTVSVDELIAAVNNALNGCPQDTTPTVPGGTITVPPTATRTATVPPTPSATAQPTTPATPNFIVRGKVLQASGQGGGISPAPDADISATIDRNGNGQIDGGEAYTGSADFEGDYSLNLAVAEGLQVVLEFRSNDSAPLFRTLEASPGGDVMLNVTLRTAEELVCTGERCALQGDRLTIEGLPAGVTGGAQLFNPVTQPDAFPGDFADSEGNVLLSGVFASVDLVDGAGQPVTQLTTPATLRMQMPRETWSIVVDITPGNGSIDVPFYAFDEVAGTWIRDGAGMLVDSEDVLISEGALASIRNGSYAGNVFARGQVQHFSYWNVDWPIESHGCISGRMLDADGMPARGATVIVRGVTYVGSSTATADADGRFCVDVLRSENPGEDVDQDGVPGETQRVAIRVTYQGRVYDGGAADVPTQPATCDVGCGNIGDVQLTPDRELQPALCTFTAVVRDRQGVLVPGAAVFAGDETVDPDVAAELCADTPLQFCLSIGSTDENGEVSLTAVVIDTLFIVALSTAQDGESTLQRWGEATSTGCPTQPVQLTLTEGYRQIFLTVEFIPPGTISWTPTTYGVTAVGVTSVLTQKWLVAAGVPGLAPPVSYGTVPPGAVQVIPFGGGSPAALASGDFITVSLTAPADDGYTVIGSGFTVVP